MPWDDELTPEQRRAASSHEGHTRMLAGPGTGKTFTLKARVQYLIEERRVEPSHILIITFTRKAVAELRERILPIIPEGNDPPRISTLHGFALRQLLKNSNLVDTLPSPLRVADNWEEDAVIIPDLQRLLNKDKKSVKTYLDEMSADWNTLTDAELNIDPQFIAGWRRIRDVYGFTLRAEMVYRLKRAMEQHERFELEGQFQHVLVDEFQDLNACDLAVVHSIGSLGASVFCAGDDDQSIYGFRKASPVGIRRFVDDYRDVEDHKLTLCKRCDLKILEAAEYVANQDLLREPKDLRSENEGGFVRLYIVSNQDVEAEMIADACHQLHEGGFSYPSIAILLRSDRYCRFSTPIINKLNSEDIPISEYETSGPLSDMSTRRLYALAQLAVSPDDSLAARVLLQLTPGIGNCSIEAIESRSVRQLERFSSTVRSVAEYPSLLPTVGLRVATAWNVFESAILELMPIVRDDCEDFTSDDISSAFSEAATILDLPLYAVDNLMHLLSETDSVSLSDFLSRSSTVGEVLEPQLSPDSVNIMTMHQAKGLTFDCVLIPGLEDELLPGNYDSPDQEGDQRRLLYVSMTRARHALLLFYATNRTGTQAYSGRGPIRRERSLSRFLADYRFQN